MLRLARMLAPGDTLTAMSSYRLNDPLYERVDDMSSCECRVRVIARLLGKLLGSREWTADIECNSASAIGPLVVFGPPRDRVVMT